MKELVFVAAFILFGLVIAYGIFHPILKNKRISGGVVNTDTLCSVFLFQINLSKQELLQKMTVPNVSDTLTYRFDGDTMAVSFFWCNICFPYTLGIKECPDGCYVCLTRNCSPRITNYINEFMIKKFNAQLLPYEEYKNCFLQNL